MHGELSRPPRQRQEDRHPPHLLRKVAADIDGDDVFDALEALKRRGRINNHGGRRADNTWIVATGKPLSAATIKRHCTVLQGVLTFAQTCA